MTAMHRDAKRLFALDEGLRREADEMLAASGIGAILKGRWFELVGSYAMQTMTRRDLDLELLTEPDWDKFWSTCSALAATGWCTRLQCVDVYREGWAPYGLYCGLRVTAPHAPPKGDAVVWTIDTWTMRQAEAEEQFGRQRRLWQKRLNDETRSYILAIKQATTRLAESGTVIAAAYVYEAVLEQDIHDDDSFFGWWRRKYRGVL